MSSTKVRCAPETKVGKSQIGRIKYRDAPETGSYSVVAAWARLKRWSTENLPRTAAEDSPPASEKELRAFETAIGMKLPKDVRESYRVYNGQCAGPGIVYGLPVQPLRECLGQWNTWVAGYSPELDSDRRSFPADFVRLVYFDRGWIPITYDSGGNHIGVDLNPGPKGKRGQVIVFGRDDEFHTVLALSWGQFLTDLADELEAGNFRIDATDPDYPEISPDDPHRKHFHSIGIYWSRGKLGIRRLRVGDQRVWKKWGAG